MPAGTIDGGGGVFLDAAALRTLLSPSSLVPHLLSSLPSHSPAVLSPTRQIFPIDPSASSSLLLMPSWSSSQYLPYIGVKIVTSFPHNSALNLPGVSASYVLFSSSTGAALAAIDGTELTLLRTSAVSALAARFLARSDARVLVMVGAGALAPYLIRAHRFVRPGIDRVIIWNRSASKARDLAKLLADEQEKEGGNVVFEHAEGLDEVIGLGDVVSCATSSRDPVVKGKKLKPGAHLDLVGSFSPEMRECDDEAMVRGRVFVDFEAAMVEAGELVGAFERGAISREDVAGTLVDLVGGVEVGRRCADEITVFKSVGTAVVDLLAGQLAYETCMSVAGLQVQSTSEIQPTAKTGDDYSKYAEGYEDALFKSARLGHLRESILHDPSALPPNFKRHDELWNVINRADEDYHARRRSKKNPEDYGRGR